jgi:hypothetical protein
MPRRINGSWYTITTHKRIIGQGQEYVVPVYVFRGTFLDAEGKQLEDTFSATIEAVK